MQIKTRKPFKTRLLISFKNRNNDRYDFIYRKQPMDSGGSYFGFHHASWILYAGSGPCTPEKCSQYYIQKCYDPRHWPGQLLYHRIQPDVPGRILERTYRFLPDRVVPSSG